jgi:hypothetical protein
MSFIAAVSIDDVFTLEDLDTPAVEAVMLHTFTNNVTSVTAVSKDQRAQKAPKQSDLLPLIKARLAPAKLNDDGLFKGSKEFVRKILINLLENPKADVVTWDRAQYNIWMTEAEARRQKEREEAEAKEDAAAKAHAEADAKGRGRNRAKHGYLYAFRYRNPTGAEWMKVGMTSIDDEAACWGRIKNYIEAHSLPRKGWEFVGFIASTEAQALEQRLHRRLRKYRIAQGNARELFRCSLSMYEAMLDAEYEFIMEHAPDTTNEEIERQKQEEAKRQAQRDRERYSQEQAERKRREEELKVHEDGLEGVKWAHHPAGGPTTNDNFMGRYGGNPKSLRNQTVGYLHDHLGKECYFAEIARHVRTTSTLGPGLGEPCEEEHVQRVMRHIKWRLEEKQKLPFYLIVTSVSAKMMSV